MSGVSRGCSGCILCQKRLRLRWKVDECKPLVEGAAPRAGPRRDPGHARGRAVQVDLMKHMLKAPGTKRFKLQCGILLSTFAFTFNLRRHTVATMPLPAAGGALKLNVGQSGFYRTVYDEAARGALMTALPGLAEVDRVGQGRTLVHFSAQLKRVLSHRGAFRDCLGGVQEMSGGIKKYQEGACSGCILCQKRLRLS